MPQYSSIYLEYLKSDAWQSKRIEKLESVGYECEKKGKDLSPMTGEPTPCSGELQIHHKTYKHLGNEPLIDLLVVCEYHHHKADFLRRFDKR